MAKPRNMAHAANAIPSVDDPNVLGIPALNYDGSALSGSTASIKTFSTDNTAANSAYAKVDSSQRQIIVTDPTAPLDVNIAQADGMTINVTAGDIDIHTTHDGANPDSMQVGDGTNILDTTGLNASLASNWSQLQAASDLVQTYTFSDPGTSDERVSTIVYSSVALSLSITETYVWAGSSPSFYLSTITRS